MRSKQNVINLFEDRNIYAVKHVVSISDDEDLNQLWEFIITASSYANSSSHPFFVYLYEVSQKFLSKFNNMFFEIIIEESEKYHYFTVWNKTFVEFAAKLWSKKTVNYKSNTKKITVRVTKRANRVQEKLDAQRVKILMQSVESQHLTAAIKPHKFIEKTDLNELRELCEDLNAHVYNATQVGFDNNSILKLRSYFSLISVVLNHYEELEEMALIMSEFSIIINQNRELFIGLTTTQIELIEGFVHNFERWLRVLFIDGGAEVNFMNNSMRADIKMINSSMCPDKSVLQEDVDAIFNF